MNWLLILLRLSHILFGLLWVGMMAFTVIFLGPALRDAGPAAGQSVMAALQRRGLMLAMPLIALVTIISGIMLMYRLYPNMEAFSATDMGQALMFGALAALTSFALGLVVMRPAMVKAGKLSQSLAAAPTDAERAELGARIQRLRARGSLTGWVAFALLLFAAGAMAVARYL